MAKECDYFFKLLLLGDISVGKTSLNICYRDSVFRGSRTTLHSLIPIAFKRHTIDLDGKTIILQMWDTTRYEWERSIRPSCYRGTSGIVLVYDVTNEESFNNITSWIDEIEKRAPIDVERIIIGNKCDMRERKVERERGENLAREHGFLFFETSAKENINVEEAIEFLVRSMKAKADANPNHPYYDDQSGLHSKKDLGFWASCSLS